MAGNVKVNQIQLGDSVTASENLVLKTNVDGTFTLARGNIGAEIEDILSIDANSIITPSSGGLFMKPIVVDTSTLGFEYDFLNIPSWAKRITMMLHDVSLNATDYLVVRVGDSGGFVSSGYVSASTILASASQNYTSSGSNFILSNNNAATNHYYGNVVLTLLDATANIWSLSALLYNSSGATEQSAGTVDLANPLDRIQITSNSLSSNFDSGKVSIVYEG